MRCRGGSALARALATLVLLAANRADAEEPLDLGPVDGIEHFDGSPGSREMLARNRFVVLPRFHKQIFSPYIGGQLPYYVTCDSVHATYHVLFEAALQEVESTLAQRLRAAARRLHERLGTATPSSQRLRDQGRPLALAWSAVAGRLLGDDARVPAELEPVVAAEVGLATGAVGLATSPLFGLPEDYSLYRPRGFYEGDPVLSAYFRAVTWLGRRGFRVADERETAAALLVVRTVDADPELAAALAAIDSVLRSLVGPADDLTVAEYSEALRGVVGADRSDSAIEAAFGRIRATLAALRDPEISSQILLPAEWKAFRARTKGLRLLPARTTPDGRLFQQLAEADPDRSLPSGLEVALALGSDRAGTHLEDASEAGRRAAANVRARASELRARTVGTHYGRTLEATALLFDRSSPLLGGTEPGAGAEGTPILPAPLFRSPAWRDRLLTTGLSAWTSLRHAWVLHAKTTVHYLGMSRDPDGVVEPAPRFYAALGELVRSLVLSANTVGAFRRDPKAVVDDLLPVLRRLSSDALTPADVELLERLHPDDIPGVRKLSDFGAFVARLEAWRAGSSELDADQRRWVESLGTSSTAASLEKFARLTSKLEEIAEAQLRGEALIEDQAAFIRDYGKTIAELQFFRGNSWLEPQTQMGFVVDVASDPRTGRHLQQAVGAARELHVVLPLRGGGHRLYRGAVYDHYEFVAPAPITDDEWKRRVANRDLPAGAPWSASYASLPSVESVLALIEAGRTVRDFGAVHDDRIGRALVARLRAVGVNQPWLIDEAVRYADGPLHDEVFAALQQGLFVARESDEAERIASALAGIAAPRDRARLFAFVVAPPPGSGPKMREHVLSVLAQLPSRPTLGEVEPLLVSDERELRARGVSLLLDPLRYDERAPATAEVRRIARLVAEEEDTSVLVAALDALESIAPREGRDHAPVVVRHLSSEESVLRASAAKLLAKIGSPADAERLVPLVEDRYDAVAAEAAEALGAVVSGATDASLVTRVVTLLEERFRRSEWRVAVGCLQGLGSARGTEAASSLERIAGDTTVDRRLRSIAVDCLGRVGKDALPHLFRLSFDESETGSSINSHQIRICDEAATELDRILDGRFGFGDGFSPPHDDQTIARVLAAIREEARRLGYVK